MPHRTTPPLSDVERQRRYKAKHPEIREKHRLRMKAIRAERRQKLAAERSGVIVPTLTPFEFAIIEHLRVITCPKVPPHEWHRMIYLLGLNELRNGRYSNA